MVYSKLNYCLPVFGHVFGLDMYRDTKTRCLTFTREDNRNMQVLQNNFMRLLTGMKRETAMETLVMLTKSLSIQQMIAFQTLTMEHKIKNNSKPTYLANRLKIRTEEDSRTVPPRRPGMNTTGNKKISTSRVGFIYRGSKLFNSLPDHLRKETSLKIFKEETKKWVKEAIKARPA